MVLQVDDLAEQTFGSIIHALRRARLKAGVSQNMVAVGLPVRGRAVSEWETGATQPHLKNLILWSGELGQRLVIVDRNLIQWSGGELRDVRQRPGDSWETFVRRQLARQLRSRRQALGISQTQLGERIGVSRDSIQRWELARVPPRPIALIVWAQVLGRCVVLRPVPTVVAATPRVPGPRLEPARIAAAEC